MSRIGRHLRGHAVAYAALFIALGGTAAASHETIFSSDIVDNEVRSIDLRDAQVQSVDVRDNTLTGADIDEATLNGLARGTSFYQRIDLLPGTQGSITIPATAVITYTCPANHLTDDGTITFQNASSKGMDLFTDDGAEDPRFDRVAPNGPRSLTASRTGDRFVYSYEGQGGGQAPFWGTISVNTVHRPDTGYGPYCRASVQASASLR